MYISVRFGTKAFLNVLKYSPVKPSGPGDLLLGSESIVWETSSSVYGAFKVFSCSSVRCGGLGGMWVLTQVVQCAIVGAKSIRNGLGVVQFSLGRWMYDI